ncbi:MAG: BON domain-containing protein [Acidobacteria bacterium]|nr:MAG: BON domain-containing protein [Acidobacteriota bacterium]
MIHPQNRVAALVAALVLTFGSCSLFKSSSAPNDEAIVASIQAKLYQDPVLKTRDVRVISQQGVVALSGTVGSDQEKSAIEQFAHSADGVKQVIDQLAVNAPQQAAAEVPAQPEPRATRRHSRARAESGSPSGSQPQAPAPVERSSPSAAQAPNTPPPAPQPVEVTIPAGTVISVRTVDPIDSSTNKTGDEFAATVDSQIEENGQIIVPRYARARLQLVAARSAGHIKGQSEVELQLVGLTVNGKNYAVSTGVYQQEGSSRGKQTAKRVGIGAAVGGIIGAIAGGGKGAAIGAGIGAGAGTGVQMATKGQTVKIPPETKLDFTLSSPLNVTVNP